MLYNKFVNRRIVIGVIENTVPLCIGAGNDSFDPTEVKSPVVKDYVGNPIIPGSSLKGVLRNTVERILKNDVFKGQWEVCDIFSDSKNICNSSKSVEKLKDESKSEAELAQNIYDNCCDVCKLFGGHNFAGKLQIKDLNLCDNEKPRFGYRDGIGIDRDTGSSRDGAKYNYEIVEAGSKFDFYMLADNLEIKQEKLFNLIIKLLEDGEISVGGKTSRGLGQVILKNKNIKLINKDNLAEYYGLV